MFLNKTQYRSMKGQQGNALVVAVFILLVLGALGFALVRVLSDASSGVVTEVYGARAQHAAQSGLHVFLAGSLFTPNQPVGSCPARTGAIQNTSPLSTLTFTAEGLQNCTATIQCDELELPTPFVGRHFRLLSTGRCEVGGQVYSRQLLIEARDDAS